MSSNEASTPSAGTMRQDGARPSIGIVGCGYVGQGLVRLFGPCEVYDPAQGKNDKAAINRCRFALVCVPTPAGPRGECDVSLVEGTVRWVECEIIVIRSTVAPGTTDRLRQETGKRIIFQPEYVGETAAHPLADRHAQSFAVLGGPIEDTSPVADLYKRFFHASLRFYFTTALCAELAKYMGNAFHAVKVTFCNEFFDVAAAFGVDYNELREVWLADPRISRDHTFVYPHDRGFAGRCLPKDVAAVIAAAEERGARPALLQAVMAVNAKYRREDAAYRPFLPLVGPTPHNPSKAAPGAGTAK